MSNTFHDQRHLLVEHARGGDKRNLKSRPVYPHAATAKSQQLPRAVSSDKVWINPGRPFHPNSTSTPIQLQSEQQQTTTSNKPEQRPCVAIAGLKRSFEQAISTIDADSSAASQSILSDNKDVKVQKKHQKNDDGPTHTNRKELEAFRIIVSSKHATDSGAERRTVLNIGIESSDTKQGSASAQPVEATATKNIDIRSRLGPFPIKSGDLRHKLKVPNKKTAEPKNDAGKPTKLRSRQLRKRRSAVALNSTDEEGLLKTINALEASLQPSGDEQRIQDLLKIDTSSAIAQHKPIKLRRRSSQKSPSIGESKLIQVFGREMANKFKEEGIKFDFAK